MLTKVRFILAFVSLSLCLSIMSTTYSRYVADTTGNVEAPFAKWQILVNSTDITTNTNSTITFEPVMEENPYVAADVIAPSSKGYFDIDVNPSNVDVSFAYTVDLEIINENIPDIINTSYSIIPSSYVEGNPLEILPLEGNQITSTLDYDKNTPDFQFEPFTIRVYFEWYEGTGELMTDTDDTTIGHLAATTGLTLAMNANISFEQTIGSGSILNVASSDIEEKSVAINQFLKYEELFKAGDSVNNFVDNPKTELNNVPVIEPINETNNTSDELKYVIHDEFYIDNKFELLSDYII